jgi:hypothetical protein
VASGTEPPSSRSALVMKSAGWVLNEFCINQTIKLK